MRAESARRLRGGIRRRSDTAMDVVRPVPRHDAWMGSARLLRSNGIAQPGSRVRMAGLSGPPASEGRVANASRIASGDRPGGKVMEINAGRAPSGRRELREEPVSRVVKEHRAGRHERQSLAGTAPRASREPIEEAMGKKLTADRGDRVANAGRAHREAKEGSGQTVILGGTADGSKSPGVNPSAASAGSNDVRALRGGN